MYITVYINFFVESILSFFACKLKQNIIRGTEPCFKKDCLEAGLDEAWSRMLAGPVFAAAVILPADYSHPLLRDSKTLTHSQRELLRLEIEKNALSSVKSMDERTIDSINILRASIKAMHHAVQHLKLKPEHLLVMEIIFYHLKKLLIKP